MDAYSNLTVPILCQQKRSRDQNEPIRGLKIDGDARKGVVNFKRENGKSDRVK